MLKDHNKKMSEAASVVMKMGQDSSQNKAQTSDDDEIEVEDDNSIGKVDVKELQQVLGEGSPKIPKLERGGSHRTFNFQKRKSF